MRVQWQHRPPGDLVWKCVVLREDLMLTIAISLVSAWLTPSGFSFIEASAIQRRQWLLARHAIFVTQPYRVLQRPTLSLLDFVWANEHHSSPPQQYTLVHMSSRAPSETWWRNADEAPTSVSGTGKATQSTRFASDGYPSNINSSPSVK